MSLDRSQMAATRDDLARHLAASGLDADDLAAWLGLDRAEIDGALAVDGRDPATVWLVRDALDAAVRRRGADAGGWSVLTEPARERARGWFALRTPPPQP